MAFEYLKRELLLLQGQAGTRTETAWAETSEARASYLGQQHILEEISSITLSRELAVPEAVDKNNLDDNVRSEGIFGLCDLDDGCSVSDQDRASSEGLSMEVCNALTARSRRWQERLPQVTGPVSAAVPGGWPKPTSALAAETEAMQATMQATAAHLAMNERMKEAVEEGILQRQDKIDKTEFMLCTSRAKAAILKLQSLEYHFLVGTYRAEDMMALNKVWEELTNRIQQLRTQVTEAQKRLTVFRSLGPSFHDQLAQFRDVQRRLLDAQYMLENFNKINSELEDGAADMDILMGGGHPHEDDHPHGGFGMY